METANPGHHLKDAYLLLQQHLLKQHFLLRDHHHSMKDQSKEKGKLFITNYFNC